MSAARLAPRTAVVTIGSDARRGHVENQLAVVRAAPERPITALAWLDGRATVAPGADVVVPVPPGPHGLRLAAARNAAADAAVARGAELLVFLDADCVPGAALFERYAAAAEREPGAILCGPVTYLPEHFDRSLITDAGALAAATSPHPARPAPADSEVVLAAPAEYPLFWSLSFAVTAASWRAGGRFDEGYEGYGGEDTDFGFAARRDGRPLAWVGGAHAYHQWHPTSSPPWAHLDDILRNGARFAERWGEWPMTGWLDAFARAGAVAFDGATWRRTPPLRR